MSGADLGFPHRKGASPLGAPTNDHFEKFSQKAREKFGPSGWSAAYASLDLPLHVLIDIIIQELDVVL